jgi:hypothetical protein
VSFPSTTYLLGDVLLKYILHWVVFRIRFGPGTSHEHRQKIMWYTPKCATSCPQPFPAREQHMVSPGWASTQPRATPGALDAPRRAHQMGVWQVGGSRISLPAMVRCVSFTALSSGRGTRRWMFTWMSYDQSPYIR